jgi:holliday junction DNA helicase RuvA
VIGRLLGLVVERSIDGCCVVDIAGVGYEVFVPLRSMGRLPAPPERATLHVHTHVREESLTLYGFETAADRIAFRVLMAVSGVGPKLAMSVMSELSANDLRTVVARQDKPRFAAISGVGKKTAERLVLELRDKVELLGSASSAGTITAPAPIAAPPSTRAGEAVSALVNLGFSRNEAEQAVAKVAAKDETRPLEMLVRQALGTLA